MPRTWLSGLHLVVAADNPVSLCDLGIFMDQTADPVPAQNVRTRNFGWRIRAAGGRRLLQYLVRAVGVVVVGVLAEDQPQVPLT
jgi:hypothetical protein